MDMPSWKKVKLGEFVEVVMGQSPEGSTCNKAGNGVPLLNGPTEFGSYHPFPVQYTTDAKKLSRKGDILFCVRGSTTGRMNWSDQEYAIGRGLAAFRHKHSQTLQPYVKALIDFHLEKLLADVTGSTFPNLNRDQICNLEVLDVDLPTQTRIASILSPFDDKIELNRQMNDTLEQMAQALFKKYFVDDIDPDNLPEGWRMGKLGEITEQSKETIIPGKFPKKIFLHYSIPAFDAGKVPTHDSGSSILSNKFVVRSNSILFSKLNPRFLRLWPIGNVDETKSICSTEFLVMSPRIEHAFSFLYQSFSSSIVIDSLVSKASGTSSSHQRIRPHDILGVELIIPSEKDFVNFENNARPLMTKIIQNINENEQLKQLRDTLLPKLMSGEVNVEQAAETA